MRCSVAFRHFHRIQRAAPAGSAMYRATTSDSLSGQHDQGMGGASSIRSSRHRSPRRWDFNFFQGHGGEAVRLHELFIAQHAWRAGETGNSFGIFHAGNTKPHTTSAKTSCFVRRAHELYVNGHLAVDQQATSTSTALEIPGEWTERNEYGGVDTTRPSAGCADWLAAEGCLVAVNTQGAPGRPRAQERKLMPGSPASASLPSEQQAGASAQAAVFFSSAFHVTE